MQNTVQTVQNTVGTSTHITKTPRANNLNVHKNIFPCNVVIVGSYTTETLIFSLTSVEFCMFQIVLKKTCSILLMCTD